jgi:hypothetical protein
MVGPVGLGREAWVFRLKFARGAVDDCSVRYERLVIEGGGASYALDFHPRLTVICGVGQIERDGIVNELVGALGATRAGVHAEIVADNGQRFAVFRPVNSHHRVISIDLARDVSEQFRNGHGEIDILARVGLDPRAARALVRIGPAELRASGQVDELVTRLAACDPERIWPLAHRAIDAEQNLREVAEETGTQPEDAAIVQAVEERHATFVAEQQRAERRRRITFGASAIIALSALGMAWAAQDVLAGVLLIAAASVAALSLRHNSRLASAEAAEKEALAAAGAQSYLGFHLQRIDGLLDDERQRKRLMQAAEHTAKARAAFSAIAGGEIEPDWAIAHRREVEARRAGAVHESTMATSGHTRLLASRLDVLRGAAAAGEGLPLVLDEAFRDIDRDDRPALLELLVERSAHQQVVLLTEDEEIATWARVEALAGQIAVVEPVATNAVRQAAVAEPADAVQAVA